MAPERSDRLAGSQPAPAPSPAAGSAPAPRGESRVANAQGRAFSLAGKTALVTGASRGIGRAIALAMAAAGADVVLGYRQRQGDAETVAAAVTSLGRRALVLSGDVADPGLASHLVGEAVEAMGRLDVLVNNAGEALQKLLLDTDAAEWDRLMAVHLGGAARLSRAALPHLTTGAGVVINIASVWGQVGAAAETAYSAAKAALIGYTRGLAREAGPLGVRVNAIAPGVIETEMLAGLTGADRAELVAATALGRLGRPADVAAAAVFLASPAASYITGQVLAVGGGFAV